MLVVVEHLPSVTLVLPCEVLTCVRVAASEHAHVKLSHLHPQHLNKE